MKNAERGKEKEQRRLETAKGQLEEAMERCRKLQEEERRLRNIQNSDTP